MMWWYSYFTIRKNFDISQNTLEWFTLIFNAVLIELFISYEDVFKVLGVIYWGFWVHNSQKIDVF